MKMTKTQISANIIFTIYAIWEILVQLLEINIPLVRNIIRIDLLIIYPVLMIMIISATIQYLLYKKYVYKPKEPLAKEIEKI